MTYLVISDCEIVRQCESIKEARQYKGAWSKIFKGEFIE